MNSKAVPLSWEEAVLWLRSQSHLQSLARDCYYGEDLKEECLRYHRSAEWAEARSLLSSQHGRQRALDLGAGRGMVSFALAEDGWDTIALEPDPGAVVGSAAIRSLNNQRIKVIEGCGENLPFDGETFDAVVARAVLHHSRDLDQLCIEVARVMKKGAVFLAVREHVISRKEDLPIFLERHPLHKLYQGENAYTLKRYQLAFRQAGLRLIRSYGPACSDINLHPLTRQELAAMRKKKLFHLVPLKLAETINRLRGKLSNEPGRLFTFFLTK